MRNHAWAKLWNSDLHGSFEVAYCTTDESSDAPDYLRCTQKERRLWVDRTWALFHRIQLSLVLEFPWLKWAKPNALIIATWTLCSLVSLPEVLQEQICSLQAAAPRNWKGYKTSTFYRRQGGKNALLLMREKGFTPVNVFFECERSRG